MRAQWTLPTLVLAGAALVGLVADAEAQSAPAPTPVSLAAAARAVLEQHCARCHQGAREGKTSVSPGVADILDMVAIARAPSLVRPGIPDGSPLYTSILAHAMPPNALRAEATVPAPSVVELEALRDWISGLPRQGNPSQEPEPRPVTETGRLGLALWTDKPVYGRGDTVTVHARASSPCRLTIINVDGNGRGTVIFPNEFDQENRVEAGQEFRLPAADAPYMFRVPTAGRETFVAICSTGEAPPDGIGLDFEKQRFTDLGDYRAFVSRAYADGLKPPVPKTDDKGGRRGAARPAERKDDAPPARSERQVRTAVEIDIH